MRLLGARLPMIQSKPLASPRAIHMHKLTQARAGSPPGKSGINAFTVILEAED